MTSYSYVSPAVLEEQAHALERDVNEIGAVDMDPSMACTVPWMMRDCRCPHLEEYLPRLLDVTTLPVPPTSKGHTPPTLSVLHPVHALHVASHASTDGLMEPLPSSSSHHPPHNNKPTASSNHATTEGSVAPPPSKKKSRGSNTSKNKSATSASTSSSDAPKAKWMGSPYVLYGTQQIRLDAVASETSGMGDVACPLLPHSLLHQRQTAIAQHAARGPKLRPSSSSPKRSTPASKPLAPSKPPTDASVPPTGVTPMEEHSSTNPMAPPNATPMTTSSSSSTPNNAISGVITPKEDIDGTTTKPIDPESSEMHLSNERFDQLKAMEDALLQQKATLFPWKATTHTTSQTTTITTTDQVTSTTNQISATNNTNVPPESPKKEKKRKKPTRKTTSQTTMGSASAFLPSGTPLPALPATGPHKYKKRWDHFVTNPLVLHNNNTNSRDIDGTSAFRKGHSIFMDPGLKRDGDTTAHHVISSVEEWLQVARLSREQYWNQKLSYAANQDPLSCCWGQSQSDISCHSKGGARCMACPPTPGRFTSASKRGPNNPNHVRSMNQDTVAGTTAHVVSDEDSPRVAVGKEKVKKPKQHKRQGMGDELLKCLECSFIGCGPCSTFADSRQHALQHMLSTGHKFAISCGYRAALFCMGCGDFVYHEVLEREMERVDICRNMPRFGWKEHVLQRSFDPLHFVTHSDHGILWQGLVATYPPLVPPAFVEAGRSSYKRLQLFRGQLDGKHSLAWGPQAMSLALTQTKQSPEENWKIRAPVGMYNLGNTCFMSSVLQCLINCRPLQCHFLRDIGHHHKSCQLLRQYKANVSVSSSSSSTEERDTGKSTSGAAARFKRSRTLSGSFGGEGNNTRAESNHTPKEPELEMCLACEMDSLFLEYFASMSGTSTIAALEEPEMPSSRSAPADCNDNNKSLGFLSSTSSNPPFDDASSLPSSSGHNSITESAEVVVHSAKHNKDPKQMQGEPLIPSALLTAAWKSGRMDHLAGYEQRDAHEFLQAFLDIMGKHESQHYQLTKKLSSQSNPSIIRQDENADNIEQDIVTRLFQGSLRSVVICDNCGCKRSQPEPFLNISLPLSKEIEISSTTPEPNSESVIGTRFHNASQNKIRLEECLRHFTAPEALSDPVHCTSCGMKTPTQKQHTFAKLPKILCLHLKRFDAKTNKKITDPVSFPAHGLDMGPHLPHWCEVVQGASTKEEKMSKPNAYNAVDEDSSCPKILYDLFGTVNHTGSLNQGHYVSNVKVDGQWYHCNDDFICKAGDGDGEKAVLDSTGAYMLFYIRQ